MSRMNKEDLIKALGEETRIAKSEAKAVINLFFDEMSETLAKGDRVEIRGLCTFYVKQYKAYAGRNHKTGEPTRLNLKSFRVSNVGRN